jgi:hypothetical protein
MKAERIGRKDIPSVITATILVAGVLGMRHLMHSPVKAEPSQNISPITWTVEGAVGSSKEVKPGESEALLAGNFPESIKQWEELLVLQGEQAEIPPELAAAIMYVESKGNPEAISGSGAVGLMQVMPKEIIPSRPSTKELLDPETNIINGYQVLNKELEQSEGNLVEALNGYFGSDEPIHYHEYFYSSYADLVLQTWQQYSPQTYAERFAGKIEVEEEVTIPENFQMVNETQGAELWQNKNDVLVAVFDLSKLDARINTAPNFISFEQLSENALAAFGGTHYQGGILEFPFKANGSIFGDPEKLASNNWLKNHDKPGIEMNMLEIFSDHAEINPFSPAEFLESQAKTVITANNIYEKRELNHARARTVVAVDQNGRMVVLVFKAADRARVETVLKELNINPQKVLNLAGGGQAGLTFNGQEYLYSSKEVTHLVTLQQK